jgi:plasmid stabilization system protein ParE
MSLRLVIRGAAERDLDEASRWYEQKGQGQGARFLEAVEQTIERIRRQPELHRVVFGDIRRMRVARFKKYYVYYRIRPAKIVVTAVFHASRDPKIWQSRK